MESTPGADSRSLERLTRDLEERIRAAARRFSLDESDVEEVIQDVRIRVWKARGGGPDGASIGDTPAGYVYRTALTAAMDLIRRRRRRQGEELPASLPARASERPDHVLEGSEVGAAVHRVLETLSERRRPVVRMYLAGYGSGEIADLLGWSEPKARNLLYRGLQELRAGLQALGIGPLEATGERTGPYPASSGVKPPQVRSAPPSGGGER